MRFRHKNIRLAHANYVGRRTYFLTFCCYAKIQCAAQGRVVEVLLAVLSEEAQRFKFAVHAYCAMPDHLHLLVAGLADDSDLFDFMKMFKQKTAYKLKRVCGALFWQKKFYDYILRPADRADGIAAYIWMNPVRAGICDRWQDYPYSGSFVLDWKKACNPMQRWTPPWHKAEEKTGGEANGPA